MTKKIFSAVGLSLMVWFVSSAAALGYWDPTGLDTLTGLPGAPISEIIINILNWLLTIIGFVAVIAFAIAGMMYLTSAGNDDQIKKAKTAMVNSIIGVIVAISGVVVLNAVNAVLSATELF